MSQQPDSPPEAPTRSGPLAGLRVVEMAGLGPAPFAAMVLADLGADVLRVDRPGGPGLQVAPPAYDVLTRGRRNVCLDLKDPQAREVVLDLVARADVLLEGFRPGVMERLGLGPQDCEAVNQRLVYARMTGWGQDGPLAGTAGHDITYVAVTGALHATGRAGGPPQVPANLLGDFGGGAMLCLVGILAALQERHASGRGQVVDAAIVDGTALLTAQLQGLLAAGVWEPSRGVNLLDTGAPFYDVYATADGQHVAVGALEPKFYAALLEGLDLAPEDVPDRGGPEPVAAAADPAGRGVRRAHPGRVGGGVRRPRRVRRPRGPAGPGAAAPAPGRAGGVHAGAGGDPAGAGAEVLADPGRPVDPARGHRPGHARGPA